MVSNISFGSVNTINGKTVLSGSQSGIDTNALVEALTKAKALPATQMTNKITANQTKISTLTSLKTALQTLQKSVDSLRNPSFGSSSTNAFAARTPFLSVTNGQTVSDYIGVATANGAPIGKYTLEVNRLATAEIRQSISFTDRTSSLVNAAATNTAGHFAAGTFQINGINVTFNQGDSLNNIAAAINSVADRSNVTANIVKYSDTDYKLVLTGKNTGAANAITITDTDRVMPYAPGVMTPIISRTQNAADAEIEFNGQTVTRASNKISDLIDNVTFSLYGRTNSETVTLDIDKDNVGISKTIGDFVTSYNSVRTFQAQQQQRDANGALVETAVLNNNSTMNTIINQLSSLISGQASIAIPSLYGSGVVTAPLRLGDLGITLSNVNAGVDADGKPTPAITNTLDLDAPKLNAALESYFDKSSNIFQFSFSSSSPSLGIYKRSNGITASTFGITVDTSQPIGSQAKVMTISGSALTAGIALDYKTASVFTSSAFLDKDVSSFVNAGGTDTPGAFAAGTFQINGQNVTLAQGMTLTGVMNAINLASANSGVSASIVKNGTGDYRLVLKGTANGTSGINFTDPSQVLPTTAIFTTTSTTPVISGRAGTGLEGFNTTYAGNGNDSITRTANISNKDITLNIDTGQIAAQRASVTKIFGATLTTPIYMDYVTSGGSTKISGKTGTDFKGLEMIYTGDGTDVINISMVQGVADKMFNSLDGMLNGDGLSGSIGLIDDAIKNLQETDKTLQKSIDTINDRVTTFRDQLLTKFAALESAISASNQLLQLLSAQTNAALVNSGR